MSLISHFLILISYALIAASLAVGLSDAVPGVERVTGYLIGAIVFVAAALLHEVYARGLERGTLAEDLHELRVDQAEALAKLEAMEEKVAALAGGAAGKSDLVAEVRVLKTLLGKLAETSVRRSGAPAPPAAGKGAAPPALLPKSLSNVEILGITRGALEANRVDLYLQPVVSLPQRKPRYYEAFSRIRSEDGGIIVPEQYIPIAEESGLISTIDNMLLFRCVQLIRRDKRETEVGLFCNISSHTLGDEEFFAQFTDFMERNAEMAKRLIFEFSQSDVAGLGIQGRDNLDRLAGLGCRFSMDQVGSLDLDFAELRRRHFHFIRVDAETLLSDYGKTGAAIHAFDLSQAMKRFGIDLIAEKVETEPMVAELLDLNVDFGQGYLFGQPRLAGRIAA